jgi:hypothetical protein
MSVHAWAYERVAIERDKSEAEVERLRRGIRNALRDLDRPFDLVRVANARATLAAVLTQTAHETAHDPDQTHE